jgi:phosphatidylserine/phosphatidylglycerophosphate/cardiolipin synthase-like enzyme
VGLLLLVLAGGALPLRAGALSSEPQLLENGAYGSTLINHIHNAKRRILCAFYLFKITESSGNLPRAVAAELVAAQRRGVDVTVILEGGKQVEKENRSATRILAQGGVRVIFSPAGVTTHAKAISIDDRYVLLGSHNLTQSALTRNNELSILLDSPQLAARMNTYLERLSHQAAGSRSFPARRARPWPANASGQPDFSPRRAP